MQRTLLKLAIFLPAAFYLADFLLEGTAASIHEPMKIVSSAVAIVAAFAVGLGLINVFQVHLGVIARRERGWRGSCVVIASFFITFALCLQGSLSDRRVRDYEDSFHRRLGQAEQETDPVARDAAVSAIRADYDAFMTQYRFNGRRFFVLNAYKPLVATAMALLGFYITFAAYSAFRFSGRDAAVMMLAAVIVVLGRDPIGAWLTAGLESSKSPWVAWISLPRAAEFVVNTLSAAFQRGLQIGLGVAVIAVSYRIMIGRERGLIEPPRGSE